MSTSTYTVGGMSCTSCARKVTTTVEQLPGVTAAEVDLAKAQLTVTGDGAFDDTKLRDAVEEAGYEVTG